MIEVLLMSLFVIALYAAGFWLLKKYYENKK
jgi:uncharacterized protein YneF (UPF0154 family)